jgi:hypothetical protein
VKAIYEGRISLKQLENHIVDCNKTIKHDNLLHKIRHDPYQLDVSKIMKNDSMHRFGGNHHGYFCNMKELISL